MEALLLVFGVMAEFGAKLCSNPGCLQHDFLPLTCSACNRVFCSAHSAIGAHDCEEGDAYLSSRRDEGGAVGVVPTTANINAEERPLRSSHPLSTNKPSEVMAAVTSRFEGREGELNSKVTHYNIKASEREGDNGAGAPDSVLKKSQLAVEKAATNKGKRISAQVHRMLLKSKAVGDKKLRMEDRFFLEIHYCGNDEDLHYLFFSRLWTIGRALDEILKTRRRFLRLPRAEQDGPLELANTHSSSTLPTGGILDDLAPQLQSFDSVTVRPRTAEGHPAVVECRSTHSIPGADGVAGNVERSPGGEGLGNTAAATTAVGLETLTASDDSTGTGEGGCEKESDELTVSQNAEGNGMAIVIRHGKAVHQIGGVLPEQSVLDIKRRLVPLTGVPFLRQKLIFKGVLCDTDLVSATKIVNGARVMLVGAPAAK